MQNRMAGSIVRARFVVASLMLMLLAGTATSARAAAPLKVAYSDWPGWVAWEVALQKGFFKDAGVDVQFVWMEYGPSIDAFTAGKVDAVTIVSGDALVSGAGGKPSTAIVLTDFSEGNDMIVGKPGINSIKDLKGQKVGVEQNLVEHLLLLKALESSGMSDADITLVNVPTNDTPQTLATGKVAAIGAWYPVSGQALKQVAGSKPLFTSSNIPGLIFDSVNVSKESLASRREDWKKLVGVWFKTVDYIKAPATHAEAVKIMAARVNVTPEDYEKYLKGTHLLDLEGNLKAFQKTDTLESVYGSMKTANGFDLKYGVYKDAQDTTKYADPALVEEVTGKKVK